MWNLDAIRKMNGSDMDSEDTVTANDKRNIYIDHLRAVCREMGLSAWKLDDYDPLIQRKVRIRAAQRYKGLYRN